MKAHRTEPKHEAHAAAAEKKASPKQKHEHAAFAAQLLHAMAPVVAPAVPHAHAPQVHAVHLPATHSSIPVLPKREDSRAHAPSRTEPVSARPAERAEAAPPPSPESSARPAAVFSADAPREPEKAPIAPAAPPAPSWMPVEAALDDTARLAIFPHALNWSSDAGSVHLQVRGGEVSLRAHGELAASLRNTDSELRVALAQNGLQLHESEAPDTGTHEREQREQQQHPQEQDEWT